MQSARNYFLTGAILAGDQNIGIRRANTRDEFHNRLHCRRFCDQPHGLSAAVGAVTQRQVFGFEPLTPSQRSGEFDLSP